VIFFWKSQAPPWDVIVSSIGISADKEGVKAAGGGPGLELLEYDHVFQNHFHREMQIAQH
jgi:hypothetical protein